MVKLKWSLADGTCSEAFRWSAESLGRDEHGLWSGARRGDPIHQPDGRVEALPHDAVWLIGEGTWWLPSFWFTDDTDVTIDICTPPTLAGDTWSFVDLELDLYRRVDGHPGIVDQEEFDEFVASGSSTKARHARQTTLPGSCSHSCSRSLSRSVRRLVRGCAVDAQLNGLSDPRGVMKVPRARRKKCGGYVP